MCFGQNSNKTCWFSSKMGIGFVQNDQHFCSKMGAGVQNKGHDTFLLAKHLAWTPRRCPEGSRRHVHRYPSVNYIIRRTYAHWPDRGLCMSSPRSLGDSCWQWGNRSVRDIHHVGCCFNTSGTSITVGNDLIWLVQNSP